LCSIVSRRLDVQRTILPDQVQQFAITGQFKYIIWKSAQ
jgi:hypothetical protein